MLIFLCLEPKCETKANWGKKKEEATTEGIAVTPAATITATKIKKAQTAKRKKSPLKDADTVEEKSL